MSKTVSVLFRERNLWAFDVSLSILRAELINVVSNFGAVQRSLWLAELEPDLRVHAIAGADFHLDLDLGLTNQQREHLLTLIAEASRRLRERETIPAAEAASWEVLDGQTVIWRSAPALATSAIAELSEAMIGLVRGTLPDPRRGMWWLFGMPGGLRTVAMNEDGDEDNLG